MKAYKTILLEKTPPIGKVVYNDPVTLNAYSNLMLEEATQAFLDLENDNNINVILLTHTGDRMGGELGVAGDTYDEQMEHFRKKHDYLQFLLRDVTKPIISYGFGIQEGDFVIVSETAKFSLPAIRFGMP
jgi:enoyl-CoA hydratase/carnithine racemase